MQSIKKSTRGFEMQFNWVFILVAGAVILAFFVLIAQKQLAISEKKQEINTLTQFSNVFSSALKNEETSFTINTKAKIVFFCTQNQCSFRINEILQKQEIPIFAPFVLEGGPLTLWSKNFNIPFHVTNFLLIANHKIKFVFISSPEDKIKKYLEQALPDTINYEFIGTINQYVPQGHDHVRFVFINKNLENINIDDPHSTLQITDKNILLNNKKYFFGEHKELMLAALFSQDSQMFETQVKKLFERVKHISQIIKNKASQNTNINTGCYTNLKVFDELKETSEKLALLLKEENMNTLNGIENKIKQMQINCIPLY